MSPELSKAMLQPIEGLEFDEASHRYRYKGKWLSTSPTGVLGISMNEHTKRKIEETKHIWEPRGNTCHQWLEHFLTGAAELDPGDYAEWIEPLRDCWLWKGCTVLASELRLVDEERNMGGSVDFIIKTGKTGAVTIGDLKTVNSRKAAEQRSPATAQLGSYIRMFSQHYGHIFIEKAVTVVAAPGYTRVIVSDVDTCSVHWEDAFDIYRMHQEQRGF